MHFVRHIIQRYGKESISLSLLTQLLRPLSCEAREVYFVSMSYNDEVQSVAATQAPPPPSESNPKKAPKKTPQNSLNNFWDAFTTKFPGKVDTVLPKNVYAKSKAAHEPKGTVHGQAAIKSYEEARTECVIAVEKIAKECKRVNMRYRDPHFDIEFDLKRGKKDCLMGLNGTDEGFSPNSVKRIHVRLGSWCVSCCDNFNNHMG